MFAIKIIVQLFYLFNGHGNRNTGAYEDSTGEITTPGNEVNWSAKRGLHFLKGFVDFLQVLMSQCLVGGDIVRAPCKVCCFLQTLTCACRSRYAGNKHFTKQSCFCEWKDAEFNGRCKTSVVSDVVRFFYFVAL